MNAGSSPPSGLGQTQSPRTAESAAVLDESAAVLAEAPPEEPTRGPLLRTAWITLGFALTALGCLGIILPGLPSTMFFVGAAACFSRSSRRFERWLLAIPIVGTLVDDYREGRGMPVGSKAITVFLITAFSTLAVMRLDAVAVKWAIAVAAAMGIIAVTFYVPTRRTH